MTKNKWFLFTLVFIISLFASNVDSAQAVNCAPSDLFSSVTGERCATVTTTIECRPGDKFSSVTGAPCAYSVFTPAQTSGGGGGGGGGGSSQSCEISRGAKGEKVKELQRLLKEEGYYFGKIDGKYGSRTVRAVKDFQEDNELSVTGNVDRATANALGLLCPVVPEIPSALNLTYTRGQGNSTEYNFAVNSPNTFNKIVVSTDCKDSEIELSTVRGHAVCGDFNVSVPLLPTKALAHTAYLNSKDSYVHYIEAKVSIYLGQTLVGKDSISIPVYPLAQAGAPVISGVSGPQSLAVNQNGTWTVTASDKNGGNLSYLVNWGDETNKLIGYAPLSTATNKQSATFTHSYASAGNYTPTFYVTNSQGKVAYTSLSVKVGEASSGVFLSPKEGDRWTIGKDYYISMSKGLFSDFHPLLHKFSLVNGQGNTIGQICPPNIKKGDANFIWTAGQVMSECSGTDNISNSVSAGKYYILFTELDSDGSLIQSGKSGWFNLVSTNAQPSLGPIGIPTATIKTGNPVDFVFSAADLDNDDLSWSIDWGDGGSAGSCVPNPPAGTGKNWIHKESHTWNNPGSYTVRVTVIDCKGGVTSTSFNVTVNPASGISLVAFLDGNSAVSRTLAPGNTNVSLATIRISTLSSQSISDTMVFEVDGSAQVANLSEFVNNIKLFDGSTQIGGTIGEFDPLGNDRFIGYVSIPGNSSKSFTIRADIKSSAPAGSFKVGLGSLRFQNISTTVSPLPVFGNKMTVNGTISSAPFISDIYPNGCSSSSGYNNITGNPCTQASPGDIVYMKGKNIYPSSEILFTGTSDDGTQSFDASWSSQSVDSSGELVKFNIPYAIQTINSLPVTDLKTGNYKFGVYKYGLLKSNYVPLRIISSVPGTPGTLAIEPASVSVGVGESMQVKAYYSPSCPSGFSCTKEVIEVNPVWSVGSKAVADLTYAVTDCIAIYPSTCESKTYTQVYGVSQGDTELTATYYEKTSGQNITKKIIVYVTGKVGVCPITAKVVNSGLAYENSQWWFDIVVNAANGKTGDTWTTNFQGYTPTNTPYGVSTRYGNFFVSAGPLKFTAVDSLDSKCTTTITVTAPSATVQATIAKKISASPSYVTPGQTIQVSWTGSDSRYDWIALAKPGDPVDSYREWDYMNTCTQTAGSSSKSSGTCTTAISSPGTYVFRFLKNNLYTLAATSNSVTVSDPVIIDFPTSTLGASALGALSKETNVKSPGPSANASNVAKFVFNEKLKRGSRGEEVRELQRFLNSAGYDAGQEDGVFGLKVRAAVMELQADNGLKADGIVGVEVRKLLNK